MEEIWRDIKGYEGLYQVSNMGRVKALERIDNKKRRLKERMLAFSPSNGYKVVHLYKNGVQKSFSVHRLVGEAFIPNPKNEPCINHRDENKLNNNVDNLEWCTQKYNNNYGTHNKRSGDKRGKRVIQFDLNGNEIRRWVSSAEARRYYGVGKTAICDACRKHKGKSHGYLWQYESEVAT